MPKVDLSGLVQAMNGARGKVEEVKTSLGPIMGNEDDKVATLQSLSDADEVLGAAILMLSDFILEANAIDADQENRLQTIEAKISEIEKALGAVPTEAPAEVPPEAPAPAEPAKQ